jgi:anthranilate phosphoribosyltransferase
MTLVGKDILRNFLAKRGRVMIKEAINLLIERQSLTMEQAAAVMEEMTGGEVHPAQFGAFVTALRMKGETAEEIAGCARAMRAHSLKVVSKQQRIVDTCGTGGDGLGTFNISRLGTPNSVENTASIAFESRVRTRRN